MVGKVWDFLAEYWLAILIPIAMIAMVWALVSARMWGQEPENRAWMDESITAMTRGEFYFALGVVVCLILMWGGGKKS